MAKQQTMKIAIVAVLCFVNVFVAAMWHLYVSALDLHLSFGFVGWAFGVGIVSGLLTAIVGILLKHPFWGIITGASVCYLLALGYIVIGRRIPLEWIY